MSNSDDNEGLGYWFRWQVPVCALIIVVPAVLAVNFTKKLKTDPIKHSDLWTPCWRNLNPVWLLVYRAFAFVCLARVLYDIVALTGVFAFYFYTQWTFALVMVYFALGSTISAYGCWFSPKEPPVENGKRAKFLRKELEKSRTSSSHKEKKLKGTSELRSHYAQADIHRSLGFWGYLMQATYQTCAAASILTDIVFWCVLVPILSKDLKINLLIGSLHALNAIFLLLDTALNSLPFPWLGFEYFVYWSCLYIAFQWIIHACGFTWWPYPFLELRTPWAPLWYLCLALVHIPFYGIYAMIVKGKKSILPRLFPHAFVSSY